MKSLCGLLRQVAVLALLCASLTTFASTVFAQEGTFVPTGSMTTARAQHTATLLNNGTVLITGGSITGGSGNSVILASAELYDPATGTFTSTGSMNAARYGHSATLLKNGKVLITGSGASSAVLASAELYDPVTGTFTATGDLNTARGFHTATLLNNGLVLIAGGFGATSSAVLASAELYNPATGFFTNTGSMTTARAQHTATLLNSGTVLIVGGNTVVAGAEVYDPATGTFIPAGNMNAARDLNTATLLNNGTVLVTGGGNNNSGGAQATAELYSPATGTFALTGSMSTGRDSQTATLLSSGTVLIAGGIFSSILASAELYQPVTGVFTPTGSLNAARYGHTATLLSSGAALIAGGVSDGQLASAELYELAVVFPTSLSFSSQAIGTTSASQTVTLTNNESAVLSITGIAVSGANASDFAETDNCVGSVPAGAGCSINVTFTPAAIGSRMGSLNIANNLSGIPLTVPLTGTGVAVTRMVSVTPSNITFPTQYVGTSGLPQSVTVTNNGSASLSITSVTASPGDFGMLNACGSTLAAGASCAVGVFFDPTASGTRTGTLTINDNASGSSQTVALSGTGQDFSLAPVSSASATVSAGQTANFTVAVSPSGGFNQSVAFACTGAPSQSTCTVSPSSIALSGSGTTTVTVNVTTMAASLPVVTPSPRGGNRPLYLITELLVLSLLSGLLSRRSGRRLRLAYRLALLLFCAGSIMSGCGSGGGGNRQTPAGTYTVVVSGTFTSGSTALTHKVNLNLVVQ